MYKQIEIDGKCWFISTNISNDLVTVIVFNELVVLAGDEKLVDFISRVKKLNKRIQYDNNTICEVLQETPTEALIDDAVLKLKYYVKSRPLVIHFDLKTQNVSEIINSLVMPLYQGLHDLKKRNEILRLAVRQKDEEIKQYRFEYGELRRTTVATKIFDFDQFDSQRFDEIEKKAEENSTCSSSVKIEPTLSPKLPINTKTKISPRSRKREFKAQYDQATVRKVMKSKMCLEYTNSQTSEGSQSDTGEVHNENQTALSNGNDNNDDIEPISPQFKQEDDVSIGKAESKNGEVYNEPQIVSSNGNDNNDVNEPNSPQFKQDDASTGKPKTTASVAIEVSSELSAEVDAVMRELEEMEKT